MNDEANETILDIVAEKRREAQDIRTINDTPGGRREALDLDLEANRIEAAYWRHGAELRDLKRENARLLAALKPVVECRVTSAVTAEIAPGRSDYCAAIIEKAQLAYSQETNNMKGKKKTLALIAGMNEIKSLEELQDNLHDCAYLAATDNRDRDVKYYCECEDACRRRIAELKGGGDMSNGKQDAISDGMAETARVKCKNDPTRHCVDCEICVG